VLVLLLLTGLRLHAAEGPDFENSIAPLLAVNCLECHGSNDPQGKLDLTRREGLLTGGENGAAVVPGDSGASYLIERLAAGEMPPPKNKKPRVLPAAEIDALRAWIDAGAVWPKDRVLDPYERTSSARAGRDWWSLAPLKRAPAPTTKPGWRVANPIDAFVWAKLEAQGLSMAPAADRRTLIRRVHFDLIGLPPTPEDVDAFEGDKSADAYEKLIDRLLAAPEFGERWARHWLDVARYAETNGYERDAEKPGAWKYRDWVIEAINSDKPYDRFVLEQLAGDELPDRSEQTVIATGLLRLGTWDDEPNDPLEYKYERLEDLVHVTSTAFLGLSYKCARCHDHKFDPIPQLDYYRIAAAFWPGPIEPRGRELGGGPSKEELGFDVLGWTDLGRRAAPLHLLRKGDPHAAGPVIIPGSPSQLPGLTKDFPEPPAEAKTMQRRLQLAQWIVDPKNPLTPRMAANRLWQHHFGAALARTPDNFGFVGQPPTHPELLDWLAAQLIDGGWRQKPLHKLILMSETYRQSALHPEAKKYEAVDAGNHWLWRANRRRLEAEILRDAMLAISGELNPQRGGPGFHPQVSDEALEGLSMKAAAWPNSPPDQRRRRSIYMFTKRGLQLPLLTVFDASDTTQPCSQRDVTIVAPQALALLNNAWIHEQSQALARKIAAGSSDPEGRAALVWRRAFGRAPLPDELRAGLAHFESQREYFAKKTAAAAETPELLAWGSLCHVLFNANEFLFVD